VLLSLALVLGLELSSRTNFESLALKVKSLALRVSPWPCDLSDLYCYSRNDVNHFHLQLNTNFLSPCQSFRIIAPYANMSKIVDWWSEYRWSVSLHLTVSSIILDIMKRNGYIMALKNNWPDPSSATVWNNVWRLFCSYGTFIIILRALRNFDLRP